MTKSTALLSFGFVASAVTLTTIATGPGESHFEQAQGVQKKGGQKGKGGPPGLVKAKIEDTVKANIYADNCLSFTSTASSRLSIRSISFRITSSQWTSCLNTP